MVRLDLRARRRLKLELVMGDLFLLLLLLAPLSIQSSDIVLPWSDDVLGLIVFKADLRDPHQSLASWSEEDATNPCNWTGISCNPRSGRVIAVELEGLDLSGPLGRGLLKLDRLERLALSRNNLSGAIPREIAVLTSLRDLGLAHNALQGEIPRELGDLAGLELLDLAHNELQGEIPSQLFARCEKLRSLDLSDNRLQGAIPPAIARCPALESLHLARNSLTGAIPPELAAISAMASLDLGYNLLAGDLPSSLATLSRLSVLRLGGNAFSGSIPDWIAGLPALEELDLSENDLAGAIPRALGSIAPLRRLLLHSNDLTGEIPPSLAGCAKLAAVDASGNNLSGAIPREIFELGELASLALAGNNLSGGFPELDSSRPACRSIQRLDLARNAIHGEIPAAIAQCRGLASLDLSANELFGSVPEEIVEMPELASLGLSGNRLSGYLPRGFGDTPSLETLKLDGNAFVGAIPDELGRCSTLRYLDLSSNNLTGSIPPALADLSNLQVLDFSFNHLTGQIPATFATLQNLSLFNVSHNSLAGPIPSNGIFPLLDPSSFAANAHLCGSSLGIDCPAIPKPIVLNPNGSENPTPIISSRPPPSSKIVLSVSAIVAIAAAAVIALGIVVVSLLNLRSSHSIRPRASFYVVDSLPGSSPSEDLAIGKLVMFTDDSDSRDEDLLPTAQALLNKNSEIGRGGFGTVYKATLAAGRTVAVKKLSAPGMVETQDEFEKRVQFLGKIQHENLVNFQGYYFTPKLQLLIYDFVPNGNLHARLHEQVSEKGPLPWELRFKVALGSALGLAYLHHKCRPRVIHYNFKSSNILLDDQLNARVSDYGLAKLLHSRDRFPMMNKFQGTLGYLAPECACDSFKVSEKCDVYGFGVVLLELITGKTPVEYMEDDVVILCDFVRSLVDEGKALSCVDPNMTLYPEDEVVTLIKLGLVCTSQVPANRPSMNEVVQILELIKPLADNKS